MKTDDRERERILAEARSLVAERGFVKDYACDCEGCMDELEPELRERFIVCVPGDIDTCMNIRELRNKNSVP